jgi:polysaccharide biosynthesis protein PslH
MVTPMPPQAQAPGAIPLVLYAQIRGLKERHEVSLLTVAGLEPGEHQSVQDLRSDGVDVQAVLRSEPAGLERWQRRWRMGSAWLAGSLPWRTVWFWEPRLQAKLDQLLASQSFDLVIVEDNAMGVYDYRTDSPLLFTEHEVRRPRPVSWPPTLKIRSLPGWAFSEIDWRRWPGYQRRTWQKFDQIQVFSPRDAKAVQEIDPGLNAPVSVNPFGIVLPEPARPEKENPASLLFVGNYTHAPNVDAALWLGQQILPRLQNQHPDVKLSLVGIYPPPEVRSLANGSIWVAGHVPDLRPLLEEAAVVLAPVRIGGGMRMKVLHAMAAGKPVVTTPRGAEGLDIWEEPLPVEVAADAESFAQAVSKLLDDPSRRAELGRRARAFAARHYSPQAYASRIEKIYAELTARKAGPERRMDG